MLIHSTTSVSFHFLTLLLFPSLFSPPSYLQSPFSGKRFVSSIRTLPTDNSSSFLLYLSWSLSILWYSFSICFRSYPYYAALVSVCLVFYVVLPFLLSSFLMFTIFLLSHCYPTTFPVPSFRSTYHKHPSL
jgi:hypothetical protein